MLTRSATRRSAVVLMMALVAMLLVATGGSARATPSRSSAGTGQVSGTPHHGRQAALVAPSSHDQSALHLDLASSPPDDDPTTDGRPDAEVVGDDTSQVPGTTITAVGRAPPAR